MKTPSKLLALAAAAFLSMGTLAYAQDKPDDKTSPAAPAPGGAGGGGGGRGGFGGPGGPGGGLFGQRDALHDVLAILGDLNLSPTFTLTQDQKDKIQVVRDDFKKQTDKWDTDHAAELKKIRDGFAEARGQGGQGGGNREKFQELSKQMTDLNASKPKADDAVKAIIAILTGDQAKSLATAQAAKQAESPGQPSEPPPT